MNPLHLCGECLESGPICCDTESETANCVNDCRLRWVLSVQPHGAPALDVEFPLQTPIRGDSIVFMEADANHFRMELTTWTVSDGLFNFISQLVYLHVCMYIFYLLSNSWAYQA